MLIWSPEVGCFGPIQLSSVVDLAMTMWHPHGIRVASWWHPGVFVGIHVFGPKKTLDFMWGK